MNKISSFENSLAVVKNALGTPATRKPPIPKDREPKLYQTSKKNNQFLNYDLEGKANTSEKDFARVKLWKSAIMMLGSFIERSPDAKKWKKSELRNFITQMEICLELKPGKLNIHEYSNLFYKLDEVAKFKDGELTKDLQAIDQIVHAYGEMLAKEKNV